MCGIRISFIALLLTVSFAQTVPGPLNGHAPVGPVKAADLVSYFLAHPPQAGNVVIAGQTGAVSKVIDGKGQTPNNYDVTIAGERFRIVWGDGFNEARQKYFDVKSVQYSGAAK